MSSPMISCVTIFDSIRALRSTGRGDAPGLGAHGTRPTPELLLRLQFRLLTSDVIPPSASRAASSAARRRSPARRSRHQRHRQQRADGEHRGAGRQSMSKTSGRPPSSSRARRTRRRAGEQAERAVFERERRAEQARAGAERAKDGRLVDALELRHRHGADEDQHAAGQRDAADDRDRRA